MKRKIFLILIVTCILATQISVFAAESDAVVFDFNYESEYNLYYSAFNGCDVQWKDNSIYMMSTQDLDAGEVGDPFVTLNIAGSFICDDYPWMRIRLKNLSEAPVFEMHFSTSTSGGIVAACCTHVDISTKDTAFKDYIFNVPERNLASMSVNGLTNEETMWTGDIADLRLDGMWIAEPSGQVPYGSEMYIEYVAFFKTKAEADAFDVAKMRAARTPEPTPSPTPVPTPTPVKTATPVKTTVATTQKPVGTEKTGSDTGFNSTLVIIIAGVILAAAVGAGILIINKSKKNSNK